MENPSTFLAFFTAVLCPSAAAALGKLTGVFFPSAALVVCTLPDTAPRVVFPTQVAHNNACPVLHVGCVVSDGELLNEGEDVEVIWEFVFFEFLFLFFFSFSSFCGRLWCLDFAVEELIGNL